MKPLVSVVIPNYNYAPFISSCVKSISSQDYENLEIIVVDDGSTDDSLAILASLEEEITIIRQSNSGVNAARNTGILNANGKYVALCDSDDLWLPSKISRQVDILEKDPNLLLVYCSISQIDSLGYKLRDIEAKYSGDLRKKYFEYPTKALIVNAPSTAMFRREDAIKVGLFDSSMRGNGEDWDFYRRLCNLGPVGFDSEVQVLVRVHENNRSQISLEKYYSDNKIAIEKMLLEEAHALTEREKILVVRRFEWQFVKAFSKKFYLLQVFRHTYRLFLGRFSSGK